MTLGCNWLNIFGRVEAVRRFWGRELPARFRRHANIRRHSGFELAEVRPVAVGKRLQQNIPRPTPRSKYAYRLWHSGRVHAGQIHRLFE